MSTRHKPLYFYVVDSEEDVAKSVSAQQTAQNNYFKSGTASLTQKLINISFFKSVIII